MNERTEYLKSVKTVVVKLGTQLLNDASKKLDMTFLGEMASQVAELRKRGLRVVLVSSGAIGAGLAELGLGKRPSDLGQLQAVAAIGQRKLMDAWAKAFEKHGLKVGQILLTRDDIDSRARFLNLRNTLNAMHELGAVPIINENDTVSTDEIVQVSFGDNDILASLVSQAIQANLLVLLSVVDGLLDSEGKSVRMVESIEEAQKLVRVEKSAMGRGGMDSKLQAARVVTESGDIMVVGNGRMKSVLLRILDGDEVGTLFVPATHKRVGRSRWIGAARPKGVIKVDAGAAAAVGKKNRSLLPAGIIAVEGQFERGDLVGVEDAEGNEIARGLTNYSADCVRKIKGMKTAEVREMMGDAAYEEVVHRDNLVVEG